MAESETNGNPLSNEDIQEFWKCNCTDDLIIWINNKSSEGKYKSANQFWNGHKSMVDKQFLVLHSLCETLTSLLNLRLTNMSSISQRESLFSRIDKLSIVDQITQLQTLLMSTDDGLRSIMANH